MGSTNSNDGRRRPRRLWYYYAIVWLVVLVFNLMVMPDDYVASRDNDVVYGLYGCG